MKMQVGRSALAAAAILLSSCGDREQPENEMSGDAAVNDVAATNVVPDASPVTMPGATSRFTSVAEEDCRTVEETSEEGGFWRRRCPGVGDYAVETTEGDLRQNLALIGSDGARDSLDLGTLGSGFSEIGGTLEWRGPAGEPFRPRTLTLRFNLYRGMEAQERPTSYLAVARLEGGAPCIVARIAPGPQQSVEARRIADAETLPGCLGR